MEAEDLPIEIQNKIFYYLEHPVAKILKDALNDYDVLQYVFNIKVSHLNLVMSDSSLDSDDE